jgi:hypothetical protein
MAPKSSTHRHPAITASGNRSRQSRIKAAKQRAKESIGVDNSVTIGANDESENVGADRAVSIGANSSETIGSKSRP